MRRYLLVAAVTATAATLSGSAPAGGASAGAAVPARRVAAGTQLWVARFRASASELVAAMAVSPSGRKVFVTGESYSLQPTRDDIETVAYSAASGQRLWVRRYSGPANGSAGPSALAVSPSGRKVFVTGSASGWGTGNDYVTVAYSAATGRQLWVRHYHGSGIGPGNDADSASAVAVSPGGVTVFVTGTSTGRGTGQSDYATVAYSAATGRQLWVRRYNGPANVLDGAQSVAVSPAGGTVFVTGTSYGRTTKSDYATVAYSADTGRQLWVSRYNGPGNGLDDPWSVAASPDGSRVFVTGGSDGRTADPSRAGDYATVAYSAATGRQLWVSRYNGPANRDDGADSVTVSPGGATVYVTGYSGRGPTRNDYATVAYNAATGRQVWVSRYYGYEASSVTVSPGGATVYVTGAGYSGGANGVYATVAYRAATGRQLWASRYHDPANDDFACCVAVGPAGRTVFVAGSSQGRTTFHYATVAYRG